MLSLKQLFGILAVVLLGYIAYIHFSSEIKFPLKPRSLNPINIGWIGPLTGSMGNFGLENMTAVALAVEEYMDTKKPSDPKVSLVLEDDQYDFTQTRHEYNKMMSFDNPVAIIMTSYSGVSLIAPDTLDDSVLIIDSLVNDVQLANLNRNIFLIARDTHEVERVYFDAILALKKSNIAILFNGSDGFMKNLAETLNQDLDASGLNTLLFRYKGEETDFTQFLKVAKEKKVDAVVFFGFAETGLAIKQARDMGIRATFFTGSAIVDPLFQFNAQGAAEGTFFAYFTEEDGDPQKAKKFIEKYQKKFHFTPTIKWSVMQTYDATNMLLEAIKVAKSQHGPFIDNLRNALLNIQNYPGVTGPLQMQKNGSVKGIHPSLYVLKNNQPEKAEAKP